MNHELASLRYTYGRCRNVNRRARKARSDARLLYLYRRSYERFLAVLMG